MPEEHKLTGASDEQVIAATLGGDIPSFGTIVERYWNMAVALALSRIDDSIEAEDVAQESFTKAYSQLSNLRNPDCFGGWFSKIVAQQCTNVIRKKARERIVSSCESDALEALASASNTNPRLNDKQVHFVRRAVSRLPEKSQKVIIMRFVAGFSTQQIASNLGKRHGTVRVWLHRAYQKLRKELAPLLEETE